MSQAPNDTRFYHWFYMVFKFSKETTDPKQTIKQPKTSLQPLSGRAQVLHFCVALRTFQKIQTGNQKTKKTRNKKNKNTQTNTKTRKTTWKDPTPPLSGVCNRFFGFFFVFVQFLYVEKNCKGEIAKSKLIHCRCIKFLKTSCSEGVPLLKQKTNFTNHHSEKTNESCKSTFKFNNFNITCNSKKWKNKT